MSSGDEIGMLLDLDEGTLSVYKNGRKLVVMMRGLAGPYCWVVSIGDKDSRVTIKRGTIPPSREEIIREAYVMYEDNGLSRVTN